MELRILAVGDVVGEPGLNFLNRRLRTLKKNHEVHFTVVNGENASGVGLTPAQADDIFRAGADVITLGNHTWNRIQIVRTLEENPYILRPANYTSKAPGRGLGIYDGPRGLRIAVLNLIGRCELDFNADSPFAVADNLLKDVDADVVLADFHAEATSEKGCMAFHLDGKAQALWGTHTHVPTADCQIMPKGLGFVTDLGFTGPALSVLGVRHDQALNRFLGAPPTRFESADGPCKMDAVLFTIDTNTKRCTGVVRVDDRE